MPEDGMPAEIAHQAVQDLRNFDKNPRLNMASYVTTYMEPQAVDLIMSSLNVNLADSEIYPSCTDIRDRCLAMLADLWHAPASKKVSGVATIGSSEACMLAALNMKKHWRDARRAAGKPMDRPNLVLGRHCQVCWEKFAAHHDVEPRFAHMKEGKWVMQPEDVYDLVDENTIGVVSIFGSTYTGHYEDVTGISAALDKVQRDKGLDLHIIIDAASGGFVAPFMQPKLEWDFRVPRVQAICASGHKYGLVYPGVGWLVWRDDAQLHKDLDFHLSYLGSDEETLTINFSRPACFVVAQYYQMLRLGRSGYRRVSQNMQQVAIALAKGLEDTGHFALINDPRQGVPLACFTLLGKKVKSAGAEGDAKEAEGTKLQPAGGSRNYDDFDVAKKMQEFGWTVPAYAMAPDCKHITAMRCVIRVDMSITIIEELLKDFTKVINWLDHHNEVLFEPEFAAETKAKFGRKQSLPNPHQKEKQHIPC